MSMDMNAIQTKIYYVGHAVRTFLHNDRQLDNVKFTIWYDKDKLSVSYKLAFGTTGIFGWFLPQDFMQMIQTDLESNLRGLCDYFIKTWEKDFGI